MNDEALFWRMVIELGSCVGWAVYCGILSHLLKQSRAADAAATFIGVIGVILILR